MTSSIITMTSLITVVMTSRRSSVARTATALLAVLCAVIRVTSSLNNGLATTPPMGWMSDERYGCLTDCVSYPDDCISERLIKSTVDTMVAQSYRSSGYQYVVLGDCWMDASRDSSGRLQADRKRFPSGMQDLVSYVHSNKLKIGLYLDIGATTCGGYPGSYNQFSLDVQTVANWQIDMVKVGACGAPQTVNNINAAFPQIESLLNRTGRPILYLCEWPLALSNLGAPVNFALVQQTCNLYRSYANMADDWQNVLNEFNYYSGYSYDFVNNSGPGGFSDPDQLVVGDYGLSIDQQRFQMALWVIMSAPLFVSADVRQMAQASLGLLLNPLVLSISQDPLGSFGQQASVVETVLSSGQVQIWRKAILPAGSYALAIFYTNISGGAAMVTITLSNVGIVGSAQYNVTEAFSGQNLGVYRPWYTLNCQVNPTGALLFQLIALPN